MSSSHKKQYFVAECVIFDISSGKILLTQRHDPKSYSHLYWQYPGGAIEYGEHPKDTAIREVMEEVNLSITIIQKNPAIYTDMFDAEHAVVISYAAINKNGTPKTSQCNETGKAQWFSLSQIQELKGYPNIYQIAKDAQQIYNRWKKGLDITN